MIRYVLRRRGNPMIVRDNSRIRMGMEVKIIISNALKKE